MVNGRMRVSGTVGKARPWNARSASMTEHEMTEAERKARDAANRVFTDFFNNLVADYFPAPPREGRRKNKYIYWQTPDQWMFCYTPWKDRDGWYYAFTYKPVGKGSRNGNAREWRMVKGSKVRLRKRKLAMKRALNRYYKRKKMLEEK